MRASRPTSRSRAGAHGIAFGIAALTFLLAATPAPRAHERTDLTIAELSNSLDAHPDDAGLRLRRAELRRVSGDPAGAAADLDALEARDPAFPGLALSRANLALDRDDPSAALGVLDRAPDLAAERGERWKLRAIALDALDRKDEAIRAWDEALASLARVEPDHFLARARLQLERGREREAREGLRDGIARLGEAASLRQALEVLDDPDGDPLSEPGPPVAAPPPAPVLVPVPPSTDVVELVRGPWLQSPTPTSIVVRWRSANASFSRVDFGPAPGQYPGRVQESVAVTEHELKLSGLSPDTRYYYTVGSTLDVAAGGDSLTFRTPPLPGENRPTRIWVLGDSGLPGAGQNAVRNAFLAWRRGRDPDVWLMLGDNAYNSGLDVEYQNGLFTPYRSLLQRWPLWLTRGNHDVVRSGTNDDYYDFFTLPKAGEAGGRPSGTEAYYSFDHGLIHFVCLDSEGSNRLPTGAMFTWLTLDLAVNRLPWTIVFFHHPPYTKGSHNSDISADSDGRMRDMRQNALPILEAAGVDLVLTGHSHSYERSYLIDGHYGLSNTFTSSMKRDGGDGRDGGSGPYRKPSPGKGRHEGAVYVVDGSSSRIEGGSLNHPVMVSSLNVLGSVVIDVDGKRLEARFLSSNAAVLDSFTLEKGGLDAEPVTGVGDAIAPSGLRLGPALPNPFRSELTLDFELAAAADVTLRLYDAQGREVATVARGAFGPGRHAAHWDGRDREGRALPAGVYLATLESEGRRVTRRIALVR